MVCIDGRRGRPGTERERERDRGVIDFGKDKNKQPCHVSRGERSALSKIERERETEGGRAEGAHVKAQTTFLSLANLGRSLSRNLAHITLGIIFYKDYP